MSSARFVHWQHGEFWLGYFEEFPDSMKSPRFAASEPSATDCANQFSQPRHFALFCTCARKLINGKLLSMAAGCIYTELEEFGFDKVAAFANTAGGCLVFCVKDKPNAPCRLAHLDANVAHKRQAIGEYLETAFKTISPISTRNLSFSKKKQRYIYQQRFERFVLTHSRDRRNGAIVLHRK